MSVLEALLRILVRLPKLFISIAKRYSSTTLHLLRYLLSFWNSFISKQKPNQLQENDVDTPTSTTCVDNAEGGENEDTSTGSATIMYTRGGGTVLDRTPPLLGSSTPAVASSVGASGSSAVQSKVTSVTNPNRDHCPPEQTEKDRMYCCEPPLRQPFTKVSLYSLICMLMFLGHPEFIQRSLKATQPRSKSNNDHSPKATQHSHITNLDDWKEFWKMFQKDVSNINLLATVLLAGNANFLNITNQHGLSYWPQRLSYASFMAALGSILVGLAVRNPRIFTAHSKGYFQAMVLVLGFPFELFLYSIILFIAALIVHLAINSAAVQIYAAIAIMGLVIVTLFFYWLVTEPIDGWRFLPQECGNHRAEEAPRVPV
ncbi:hypothetical protein EDD16DRAFT_1582952 [Pisolithus croceorrhizus]|nr:hypothetical protein EV401DRAFT_2214437 [Pisolithus croceorrhizus]KAI6119171.1 hypothetical protein EDD16DRAFT_1582952 [Pisolithus croceorrhizus]KAI6160569.1 hypothetical protein EDD17DRAFT_794330 [Pisolithus thermaeus]